MTWGSEEWPGVSFNEREARRLAEAETSRDALAASRGFMFAVLFSLPFWAVLIIALVVIL